MAAGSAPLTPFDAQQLQQAHGEMHGGALAAAEARIRQVLQARRGQPDALHLLGMVLARQGRRSDARAALEGALKASPRNPHIHNSLGNVLADMGETDAAMPAFEAALKLDPRYADAWINLGITATSAGRPAEARAALQRALALAPDSTRAWSALAYAEQQAGNPRAAAGHFQTALGLDPKDLRARHNLGAALRQIDELDAALAHTDQAIRDGLTGPDVQTLRAHVLADLGRFEEAVAAYETVLRTDPAHIETLDALARLLPQLDGRARALDGFRTALQSNPTSVPLWRAAMATAQELKDYTQAIAWADEAMTVLGHRLEFDLGKASALAIVGEPAEARRQLEALATAHPDVAAIPNILTHLLIKAGDLDAAEQQALRATALAPLNQTGWSYLTVIWRLLDDPREAWLADYERLVMPIDLPPPDGYASTQAFLADLEPALLALHQLQTHPAEQSLRGGTQTRGNIFDKKAPLLQLLATSIRQCVAARIATLPQDAGHPFLARNSGAIRYSGSWSVRLRSEGFHISHVHPMGWISSAFYVSLPPEVQAAKAAGNAMPPGAIAFGTPDATLGLDLPPRRVEVPQPGRLVLFPSYLWHGTIPFTSSAPRMTVAFDALPA